MPPRASPSKTLDRLTELLQQLSGTPVAAQIDAQAACSEVALLLRRRDIDLDGLCGNIPPASRASGNMAAFFRELGAACLAANRTPASVAALRKARSLGDGSAETCKLLGDALYQAGHLAEATRAYNDALEIDPECPVVLMRLARLSQIDGAHEPAVDLFSRAGGSSEQAAMAHLGAGLSLRDLGRYDESHCRLEAAWGGDGKIESGIEQEQADDLRLARIDGCTLVPLAAGSRPLHVKGGIQAPGAAPKYLLQRRTFDGAVVSFTDVEYNNQSHAPVRDLAGTHVYAGPFFGHFGHFMSECLHRFWGFERAAGQHGKLIVLHAPRGPKASCPNSADQLGKLHRDALAYFHIPAERVELISEPTRVEQLMVPEQASLLGEGHYPSEAYLDWLDENEQRFFQAYNPERPAYPERVYFGRSHLIHSGAIAGESYLECLLAQEGFQILRPEQHSLFEQLAYLRNARVCLFSEGSALHGFEALGRLERAPVVAVLGRRCDRRDHWATLIGPRTPNFAFFSHTVRLPGINFDYRNGWRDQRACVSVIQELDLLVRFLSDTLGLSPTRFDRDTFYCHEAADIARFLVNAPVDPRVAAEFHGYFDELRSHASGLGDNPYLG